VHHYQFFSRHSLCLISDCLIFRAITLAGSRYLSSNSVKTYFCTHICTSQQISSNGKKLLWQPAHKPTRAEFHCRVLVTLFLISVWSTFQHLKQVSSCSMKTTQLRAIEHTNYKFSCACARTQTCNSSNWIWRIPCSGMLCHVVLVRTDVSEEHIASIISVRRIGELGTLAVTSNHRNTTWYYILQSISLQCALVASYC
jgi:hypothetical protein